MFTKRPISKTRLPTILILFGIISYANSFSGPFIFDDEKGILENPYILHLWPPGWMSAPVESTVVGRPIASLSLALNYAISGYEVWSYHAFNLAIHILSALALYGIIRRTLLCKRLKERFGDYAAVLAWAAAVLWLVHPIQTGSVTYVIQRAESLMGLFYLLTLYSAIRVMESNGSPLWLAASVICCGLGMGTKEVMVTAPVLVLLYDRTFAAGSFAAALRRRWGLYGGMAATWLILTAILWSCPRQEQQKGFTIVASLSYAANQGAVIMHYLRLVLWPKGLCLDYNRQKLDDWGKLMPPILAVLALLAVTVWGLVRNRAWSYPAAWFFGILAVTSSFVPVKDLIFEHRMYLPLAGVVVMLVLGGHVFLDKAAKRSLEDRRRWTRIGIVFVIILSGLLVCLTLNRNEDYRDAESVWWSVLEIEPNNPRAHNNIGVILQRQGMFDEAIRHHIRALQIDANSIECLYNLGTAFRTIGQFEQAINYYSLALRMKPDYIEARVNLGVALAQQGKIDQGIGQFQQALQLEPNSAEAHNDLGIALGMKGNFNEAVLHYRQAINLKPDWPLPLNGLAWILATYPDPNVRDAKQAIEIAERAAAMTNHQDAIILNTLAAAYAAAGQFDKAAATAQQALDLARAAKNDKLINQIFEQLENYRQGKPRTQ